LEILWPTGRKGGVGLGLYPVGHVPFIGFNLPSKKKKPFWPPEKKVSPSCQKGTGSKKNDSKPAFSTSTGMKNSSLPQHSSAMTKKGRKENTYFFGRNSQNVKLRKHKREEGRLEPPPKKVLVCFLQGGKKREEAYYRSVLGEYIND